MKIVFYVQSLATAIVYDTIMVIAAWMIIRLRHTSIAPFSDLLFVGERKKRGATEDVAERTQK